MSTTKDRVSAYLPKELALKLQKYCSLNSKITKSKAIIQALTYYFDTETPFEVLNNKMDLLSKKIDQVQELLQKTKGEKEESNEK